MQGTITAGGEDLAARWRPTDEQMSIAAAMLRAGAARVMVGIALPGKGRGWWMPGQRVMPVPGYWPVMAEGDNDGYSRARELADRAAGEALGQGGGTSSYAVISLRDDEPVFAVYEGIFGTDVRKHPVPGPASA